MWKCLEDLKAIKISNQSKILSPEKNPVYLIVSSCNVACAYAYIRIVVDLKILFALASGVVKVSIGQDLDDWSVFELRCLAANKLLIESFFCIFFNGFRKLVP